MQVLVPYVVGAAMLTASSVPETDYAAWSAATVYAAGQRVIRTATHRIYQRVLPGVTATPPELDATNWDDIAPTARWAMFDQAVGTITSSASPLSFTVDVPGAVGDIVLLSVTGVSVTVTLPEVTRTVAVPPALIAGQGSTVRISDLASAGGACQIALTGSGTVGIGTVCIGSWVTIARSQAGASGDLEDFSVKAFDQFGGLSIVPRAYRRRLAVPFEVDQSAADHTARVLAAARSSPVLWLGLPSLQSTLVYGLVKDWRIAFPAGATLPCTGSLSVQSMALGM